MTQDSVITIMQTALKTIIFTAAPPLLCSLVVGIAVSIFQTITSISEQTRFFVNYYFWRLYDDKFRRIVCESLF